MSDVTSESSSEDILKALCESFGRLSRELNNGALLPSKATRELGETRRLAKVARLHLNQRRAGSDATTRRAGSRSEH